MAVELAPETRAWWERYAASAIGGIESFKQFVADELDVDVTNVKIVAVTNVEYRPVELTLEPLSVLFWIPAGVTYELVYYGDPDRKLDVTEDGFEVWDVDNWAFGLFQDGVTLEIWPEGIDPRAADPAFNAEE